MLIYRCDRCSADSKSSMDLIHIEIGADSDNHTINRHDIKVPYRSDVCKECAILALVALKKTDKKP